MLPEAIYKSIFSNLGIAFKLNSGFITIRRDARPPKRDNGPPKLFFPFLTLTS